MKLVALLGGLVLAALVLPFLVSGGKAPGDPTHLPWQVEALGDGRSRVFGLTLPTSTLADARRLHGGDVTLGLIRDGGGTLTLEAYHPSARLGFVTGKLILTLADAPERLAAMAQRAVDAEATRSGSMRFTLSATDTREADRLPIAGITLIPSVDLQPEVVIERFGEPVGRIASDDGVVHLLYPERGLDLLLVSDGREVLQYVAPADFAELIAPLAAASGDPAQ
ncbi:MAG: hypothetical protein KDG52_03575 [Rhodocyclaceae bacterium]|nr:hypothetical protein [Rhodocyclaceae bacterium]